MFTLDRSSPVALSDQIEARLRELVARGQLPAGARLSSIRQLASELAVSPNTVITAYDLNEGTIKWQVPLGNVPGLAAKGIKNTGSYYHRNGPVVTAGGLVLIGSWSDSTVRAFDKRAVGFVGKSWKG